MENEKNNLRVYSIVGTNLFFKDLISLQSFLHQIWEIPMSKETEELCNIYALDKDKYKKN